MSPLTSTIPRLVSASLMRSLPLWTPPVPYGTVYLGVNPATPTIINVNVPGPVGVYNQIWLVPISGQPDRYRLKFNLTNVYAVVNDLGDLITTTSETDTFWSGVWGYYMGTGIDDPVAVFYNGVVVDLAPLDGLGPL